MKIMASISLLILALFEVVILLCYKYPSMVTPEVDLRNKDVVPHPLPVWNMSKSMREEFQQAQVQDFCNKHGLDGRGPLFKGFMLTNDKKKTIFCYSPKVGCTTLKILFFQAQDIPINVEDVDKLDMSLQHASSKHSLVGLNDSEISYKLENYYKFIMYRDPVGRLLSAYREKIERIPLLGLNDWYPHFNWANKDIYKYNHPEEFKIWKSKNGKTAINITFSDFIDFWLNAKGRMASDAHFLPIFDICHPCRVRYSYYGNFKRFREDANILIDILGSNRTSLRNNNGLKKKTSDVLKEYYGQLSSKQKVKIVDKLAWDLSFYYAIFPTEKENHKEVMDIDYDVPEVHKNSSIVSTHHHSGQ